MKLHLPLPLFRSLTALFALVAGASFTASGAVMKTQHATLLTYADFGQNMGRYVTGGNVNGLLAYIRQQEGGVLITYTDGTASHVLPHGVPDFSSVVQSGGGMGAGNLVAPNAYITAQHNGTFTPSFSSPYVVGENNDIRYQGIEYRNSAMEIRSNSTMDIKITRLNKLVTDVAPAAVYSGSLTRDALFGQTVYHSGAGRQYVYNEEAGQNWWQGNPGTFISGGATELNGSDVGNTAYTVGTVVSVGDPALSPAAPLPYQPQDGDSGSPLFIWDTAANQFAYIGSFSAVNALEATGGHTTYSKAIFDPMAMGNLEAFTDTFIPAEGHHRFDIMTSNNVKSSKTETITTKDGDKTISTTYTIASYHSQIWDNDVPKFGADSGVKFNHLDLSKNVYTWAALNDEMDKDNWFHYGSEYMNATQDATSKTLRTWSELYASRDNRMVATDGEDYSVNFTSVMDMGLGTMQLSKADNVESASFVFSYRKSSILDYSTAQLLTSGYIVDKGVTLHLQFNNPESYVREWRKVGEGTLSVEGEGDNYVLLNVGGAGKTVLDRTNGFAAYNVLANTGSTVVINGINQIARDFTFGNGGATLDFNGHSMTWNNGAAVADDGFSIHALTQEALITNNAAEKVTLSVTDGGTNFLGSFSDAGAGALAIDFNGTAWELNSIRTDLSHHAGSGLTVSGGEVSLAGTLTQHASGTVEPGKKDAYSNADDWHYSDASMNVAVKEGGTFELGSHARLTGEVTVEQGGTYVMHEGVKHAQEYVEGGQVLEETAKYSAFYGHKGGVVLNGGTLAVQLSEDTDTDFTYDGTISGSGSVSVDAAGSRVLLGGANTMSGSNTVERGTLVATGADSLGRGTWTVKSGAVLTAKAFETADRAAVLAAVGGESAGILALTADRSDSLSADTHRNLIVGAAEGSTVNYGSAGDTLAAQDGQWKLGGGGGTLVVKSALNDTATLALGDTGAAGTVVLEHAGNSMNGITVAEQAEMVLKGDMTLNNAAAVTVGNGASLSLTDATVRNLGTTTVSGTVALNNVTADGTMVFTGDVSLDGAFTNNGHVIFNGNVNIGNGSATRLGTVYGTGGDATAYTATANGFRGEGVQMGTDVGILGSGSYELAGGSTLTYAGLTPTISTKTGDTTTAVQVETDGIFYVNSGTVTAGGSSATAGTDKATGFSVQKDATLTLAGTTGSKLATATGEGTIQITANTTLANNTATAFNGMVEVTGGTLALGTSADYAKANVSSLAGIRLNGGTLSYGGNGTEDIKRLETAVSSVLNISSTGGTGSTANSIHLAEAALGHDLEINTTYATQMTVGQLSGSGDLTVHGADNASWGTLVAVAIESLEGFSGSLNFDRKRNASAAVTRATIQSGAEDVTLRGISLADGATATITAEKAVSLGSVDTAKADLEASSLALRGGSFSAESLNIGAGDIALQNGATLSVADLMSVSAAGSTATLTGGKVEEGCLNGVRMTDVLAEMSGSLSYTVSDMVMSGASSLHLRDGVLEAADTQLRSLSVDQGAAVQGTALSVAEACRVEVAASLSPVMTLAAADEPAPVVLYSQQLAGVQLKDGASLTLNLDGLREQLRPDATLYTVVFTDLAWESGQADVTPAVTLQAGSWAQERDVQLLSAVHDSFSTAVTLSIQAPEPATATLSLLALAALAARRKRR